jgi:hypothetical protein
MHKRFKRKINAQQSFDMSQSEMMDEGLVGMRGRPEVNEEEKMYLNNQYQIVEEKIKQEDKDRAEGRSGVLNMIRQKYLMLQVNLILLHLQMVVEFFLKKVVSQKILVEEDF